jgi:hypothetical protein
MIGAYLSYSSTGAFVFVSKGIVTMKTPSKAPHSIDVEKINPFFSPGKALKKEKKEELNQ